MWMATTEAQFETRPSECDASSLEHGFRHPRDILEVQALPTSRKREVLAAWASDASAVQDQPTLRWLLGTPEPVPLVEILGALDALDERGPRPARPSEGSPPLPSAVGGEARDVIRVEPFGEGWAVCCPQVVNPQIFRSGRAAERAAKRLAGRLAAVGRWAEIWLTLRDGSRAGRFVCAPQATVKPR